MRQSWLVGVLVTVVLSTLVGLRAADRQAHYRSTAELSLVIATYPVADLVVPSSRSTPGALDDKKFENEFRALERHLRSVTGTDAWTESCSIKPFEKNLSLVIRQTSAVHERIAQELNRLRRELDVQVALSMHVIKGRASRSLPSRRTFPENWGNSSPSSC